MEYIFSFKNYVSELIHKNDSNVDILKDNDNDKYNDDSTNLDSNNIDTTLNDSFVIIENLIPKPPPYPNFHRIYYSKEAWKTKLDKGLFNKSSLEDNVDNVNNDNLNNTIKKTQTFEHIKYKQYNPHNNKLSSNLNDYFGYKKYYNNLEKYNLKNASNFNVLGNFKYNFTHLGNLPPIDIYKNNLYKPIKGNSYLYNLHQPHTRMTSAKYNNKKSGPK
jgi:hypothetical protein